MVAARMPGMMPAQRLPVTRQRTSTADTGVSVGLTGLDITAQGGRARRETVSYTHLRAHETSAHL
eukprot:12989303-Alexandrium_andersonii.AAC.1